MARVTSTEIEVTLRMVGVREASGYEESQHLTNDWETRKLNPFDLLAPEPECVRYAAESLAVREWSSVSGEVDLWALTLESAVVVAVRAGDLDTAAALGSAAALLGPAGLEAADCAAAFIVSRRSAEGGFLQAGSSDGFGRATESTVAACARALRATVQGRDISVQRKVGHV